MNVIGAVTIGKLIEAHYEKDEHKFKAYAEFHHDSESKEGFCAMKDLFYNVNENTEACEDYVECKVRKGGET